MKIRQMCAEDISFAAECTAAEGWVSEDSNTLQAFFLHDSQGCLLAEQDSQPVGICIATHYGKSGFIGELIVRPDARGKGIGAELLNKGVALLKTRGAETVYLDGVLKAVGLYERNGFRKICRSWRFSGKLVGKADPKIRQMKAEDVKHVIELDRRFFGADRGFFLRRRFELFPELGRVSMTGKRITGYIMGRAGETWISAGPWVTEIDGDNPAGLLESLAMEARGRRISMGILESNHLACALARSVGFTASDESPWRMVQGHSSDLGAASQCIAIGSAAKG